MYTKTSYIKGTIVINTEEYIFFFIGVQFNIKTSRNFCGTYLAQVFIVSEPNIFDFLSSYQLIVKEIVTIKIESKYMFVEKKTLEVY